MSTIENVIASIVWPAVAIFALFKFGKPIEHLLSGGSWRLKYGNLDAEIRAAGQIQGKQQQTDTAPKIDRESISKYQSPVLKKWQNNIERDLKEKATELHMDEHALLLHHYTELLLMLRFEQVYNAIFGSQIRALEELARLAGQSPLDHIRRFYMVASAENKKFYETYPFESWLGFLINNALVRIEGDVVILTDEGQEFIPYLIRRKYLLAKMY